MSWKCFDLGCIIDYFEFQLMQMCAHKSSLTSSRLYFYIYGRNLLATNENSIDLYWDSLLFSENKDIHELLFQRFTKIVTKYGIKLSQKKDDNCSSWNSFSLNAYKKWLSFTSATHRSGASQISRRNSRSNNFLAY